MSMASELLAEIRDRAARDYAAHESGIYLSNELVADRLHLLAEVDALSAELRLADAHARDSDAALAHHKAVVDQLKRISGATRTYCEGVVRTHLNHGGSMESATVARSVLTVLKLAESTDG